MFYKITFEFGAPLIYIERPTFDSILAFCYMREQYGEIEQKLTISKNDLVDFFAVLPLCVKENDGMQYFNASWLLFDENMSLEGVDSYKKRFDFFNDDLLDFGGKTEKITINNGDFKSYDIPVTTHFVRNGWFYFESNDVNKVNELVSNHLYGIGKKTAYGYGKIKMFHVEHIKYDPFVENVLRPIPVLGQKAKENMQYCAYKPPYWLPCNFNLCKVR